jgi:enoyl-CoA hydratase/carnithine racemase
VSLRVSRGDGVGWIRLDRPEKRNAIDWATRGALGDAFADFEADSDVRVVVLTGEGTAFCAGVDLSDAPAIGPLEAKPLVAPLDDFSKPVLAAINGPAVGGGLELALACDLRIASDTATFALPEVRLGSLPGSGGTQRLSGAVAAKLLFTGDPIDAQDALRAGIVSDVVPADELLPLAERLAARIAQNAPLSRQAAKLALRAAPGGRELERALWAFLSTTADRAEGRAAFREKRTPEFEGR